MVEVEELSAMGVEGMLEALEIVNQRTDREALGAKVGELRCVYRQKGEVLMEVVGRCRLG